MELKRVEISGFKSFVEKIQVEFGKGITAIVGPNGSGKSNISDAVRWVLGEQSAKSLRGGKMEDVIFAGTERRKPLNFAQVTLVLDNHDKKMAVDYSEVAISRRVYRSGESEYTINGSKCRLKDVQELLMDTGIGKDGYSVIGQGQIDRLLSSKPQDRRLVFEEAAGIVKYKTRKEQAEKQLAEEADNLSRVQDILEELSSRLEPLEKQAETAEKYLALKDELKTYEVSAFLGQYKQYQEQYDKAQGNLLNLQAQLAEAQKAKEEAQAQSEQYAREAEEARRDFTTLSEAHSELRLKNQEAEGDKRLLLQQTEGAQQDMVNLERRLDDVKARMKGRLDTIKKEEARVKSLEQELTEKSHHGEEVQQTLSKIEEQIKELEASYAADRKDLDEQQEELSLLRAKAERQSAVLEQDEAQQETMQEQETELRKQQEELATQLSEAEDLQTELQKKDVSLTEALEAQRKKVDEIRQALQQKQKEQESLMLRMRELQSRIKWLTDMERDYEGFSGSVRAIMQMKKNSPQRYQKVHGTLSDVLTVPSEYALAVEIALGPALQNVIVEDTACAKDLIEALRSAGKGRATFLPLDRVTGRGEPHGAGEALKMPQVIGFAGDLIEYDARYEKIVSRQLGNVLVVRDFDSAAAVASQYSNSLRVVTLKGDIFNTGGSITGGSAGSKAGGILSRKGERQDLEKNLAEQRAESSKLAAAVSESVRLREAARAEENKIAEEKEHCQQELAKASQDLSQLVFLQKHVDGQLAEIDENKRLLLTSSEQHQEEAQQSREAVEALTLEVAKQAQKTEAAEEALKGTELQAEESRQVLSRLQMEMAGKRQEKQFTQRAIERENEEIENLAQEADQILEEQEERRSSVKVALQRIQELEESQVKLTKAIEEKEKEMQEQEEQRAEKDRRRDESTKAVQETLLTVSNLEKEQIRLEGQAGRAKKDLNDLQDRIWEEYELTYGAAKAMAEKMEMPGSQTAMKRRISQLREEIRSLGNVNVDAITELIALRERCEFLGKQRDDIAKSEESLREIIDQLTQKMEEQFAKGFASVAKTFNEVFRSLFGGGQGLLQLTEGENALEAGIEIIAQPPGKKLQNMMLLSGGERALTAIALLFAIHQLNPAPFCILDEIEAALDDTNVVRFADYLKEMCEHTQFIVITHRKGTMEAADTLYGVTMEEKGVSKCISVNFQS